MVDVQLPSDDADGPLTVAQDLHVDGRRRHHDARALSGRALPFGWSGGETAGHSRRRKKVCPRSQQLQLAASVWQSAYRNRRAETGRPRRNGEQGCPLRQVTGPASMPGNVACRQSLTASRPVVRPPRVHSLHAPGLPNARLSAMRIPDAEGPSKGLVAVPARIHAAADSSPVATASLTPGWGWGRVAHAPIELVRPLAIFAEKLFSRRTRGDNAIVLGAPASCRKR